MVFSHVTLGRPGGLFQFSGRGTIRIILASASSSICAMWPNVERRRDWIITVRLGCLVILLTSLLHKLVPFDSKQCSQAPLIKSINRADGTRRKDIPLPRHTEIDIMSSIHGTCYLFTCIVRNESESSSVVGHCSILNRYVLLTDW